MRNKSMYCTSYHTNVLLGDFNAKVVRDDLFTATEK
jgi:hypothetical protein